MAGLGLLSPIDCAAEAAMIGVSLEGLWSALFAKEDDGKALPLPRAMV